MSTSSRPLQLCQLTGSFHQVGDGLGEVTEPCCTPQSIADAKAFQQRERQRVTDRTGLVLRDGEAGGVTVDPELVRLRLMNVTHAAIHQVLFGGDGPLGKRQGHINGTAGR